MDNIRNLFAFCVAAAMTASLASCKDDAGAPSDYDENYNPTISLKISSVNAGLSAVNGVKERLGTLRVIMVHKDASGESKIEYNKLLTFKGDMQNDGNFFTGDGEDVDLFRYVFTKATIPGEKKFYLIANESNVESMNFNARSRASLPDEVTASGSLTTLLDRYVSEVKVHEMLPESEGTARGEEFENVMNSVFFQPRYEIDESNNIFIPYTAVYEGFQIPERPSRAGDGNIDADMFLVPVATKFDFQFINYRKKKVRIEDIKLSSTHSRNYLHAQLGENERMKNTDKESLYWIDWLARVSGLLQNGSSNSQVNDSWGWIDEFDMPFNDDVLPLSFNSEQEEWTIEERVNSYTPSTTTFGPFYLPESRNVERRSVFNPSTGSYEDKDVQTYRLSFYMRDHDAESVTTFEDNDIENLKSLFRSTHVLLTVTLYDEEMDIFAQTAPWNTESFKGYLQESDEDD